LRSLDSNRWPPASPAIGFSLSPWLALRAAAGADQLHRRVGHFSQDCPGLSRPCPEGERVHHCGGDQAEGLGIGSRPELAARLRRRERRAKQLVDLAQIAVTLIAVYKALGGGWSS
jgi:hypothetical protein